jgi:alpha-galactosidase
MKVETILSEIEAASRPRAERPVLMTRRIGWGSLKSGTSVGGQTLRLGNAVFEHGWGDHAQSRHVVRLPSPAARFEAFVGVQGHIGFTSRLVFSVYAPDGRLLARSPGLGAGDEPFPLSADLAGLTTFEFGVVDVGVPEDFKGTPPMANANWCDPVITLADGRRLLADDFVPEEGFPMDFLYDGDRRPHGELTFETVAETPEFVRWRIAERLPDGRLTIVNTVTAYRDFPVVEWLPELVNDGDAPSGIVSGFHSLSLSLDVADRSSGYIETPYASTCRYPLCDIALRRTLGSKNCQSDFTAETVFLRPRYPDNRVRLDTDEGRSSAAWLPFFGLDFDDAHGLNVGIGWSGRWFAEFSHHEDRLRVEAGMPETNFRVLPGERLRQPSVFIHQRNGLSVEDGQNELRRFLLKYHSPHNADGSIVRTPFPLTEWGGQTTEGLLRTIATKVRHDLPFDTFWVDAGWFGDDRPVSPTEYGNSDWARTVGNWRVNQVPHPGGFKPVSEAAHKAGMKFLLWVEMERVTPDCPVAREHPEWILHAKKNPFSLLLNLGDDGAREWAIAQVDRLVREEGVDYYRQDFNFNTIPYWYDNDAPDRIGVTEMKYIAGLYRFWDTLRERFPDMLIDNCASGGRRIDFETNSRSICLYRSDMLGRPWYDCAEANHIEIPYLSAWVPLHAGGTTVLPGDDYAYLSGVTTGTDGPVFDEKLPFDPVWYREVLVTARRMAECFYGDFYLLTPHPETRRGIYAYQCHLPEEGRGFFAVFRRPEGDEAEIVPALRAIDLAARYEVETFRGTAETLSGAELVSRAVRLDAPRSVRVVFYRRAEE